MICEEGGSALLDEKIFDSVRDFLYLDNRKVYTEIVAQQHVYIFDNMILTHLNKLCTTDLEKILSSLNKSDYILIPTHIMYETAQNQSMPRQVYDSLYLQFFETLCKMKKVCVFSFHYMYEILLESSINQGVAFELLKSFAQVTNELNLSVYKKIVKCEESPYEIETILTEETRNSGERIINLFVLILLNDGLSRVYTCSNDQKGIYSIRKIMRKNEFLLQLLALTEKQFTEGYRVLSWDKILFDYARGMDGMEAILEQFLERCRGKHAQTRQILYVEDEDAEYDTLDNQSFFKLIMNPSSKLTF